MSTHTVTHETAVTATADTRDTVVDLLQLIAIIALATPGLAAATPIGQATVSAAEQTVLTGITTAVGVATSVVTPDCAEEDGSGQAICTWHGDRQGDGSGDSVLIVGGRDLARW